MHPFADGVTVMVAAIGEVVELVATNEGISPDPLAARPMSMLLFVQVNVDPPGPEKFVIDAIAPVQ